MIEDDSNIQQEEAKQNQKRSAGDNDGFNKSQNDSTARSWRRKRPAGEEVVCRKCKTRGDHLLQKRMELLSVLLGLV